MPTSVDPNPESCSAPCAVASAARGGVCLAGRQRQGSSRVQFMPDLEDLERRVADLDARLDAAESALAIQSLKARYAALVDARFSKGRIVPGARLAEVADEIAALFTEDGVWDGGPALGVASGRAAIAERMRAPTLTFSWHFFLKPRIEVDGDTATARWDILSPCTTHDGTPHWMVGYEDDSYRRVGGEWLHERMKLTAVFMSPHETGWREIWT